MSKSFSMIVLGISMTFANVAQAKEAVVIFNDNAVHIEQTLEDPTDLWVTPEDLTRITGFELKPEGACFEDICIPIRQDADNDMFVTRLGKNWVNASRLAAALQQGVAVDHESGTWSFGEIPSVRNKAHATGIAPDFALTDRQGNTVRLSDYRGKKVILLTWASW